ncbi:MAG: helix-turn-helix transcriptional regulator [bacterium]|nr:helix-turn-helix transcriptional regulator [bacterium]
MRNDLLSWGIMGIMARKWNVQPAFLPLRNATNMRDLIWPNLTEARVFSEDHPELRALGIMSTGLTRVHGPRTARSDPGDEAFGHVHVTIGGEGNVYVKGRWVPSSRGTAYACPPGARWGWRYNKTRKEQWSFLFVRFFGDSSCPAHFEQSEPYILPGRPFEDFHWAFGRLYSESIALGRRTVIRCLGELVTFHACDLVRSETTTYELESLWASVANNLAHPWTLSTLAEYCRIGREKLRQVSVRETGRSPMQQVRHLRLRHAAQLLRGTTLPMEHIAERVGYSDAFSFSTAFKRHYRRSPVALRREKAQRD